jgi:uncharacterized protein (TIGR03435 family)
MDSRASVQWTSPHRPSTSGVEYGVRSCAGAQVLELRTLLGVTLAFGLAAPTLSGQPPPAFEVASVKPIAHDSDVLQHRGFGCMFTSRGRVSCIGWTRYLIAEAYDLPVARLEQEVIGGPGWIVQDLFEIQAILPTDDQEQVTTDRFLMMLRSLLAERFQLVVHRERKEIPGYALAIARNDGKLGSNLQPTPKACADWIDGRRQGEPPLVFGNLPCGRGEMRANVWRQSRVPLSQLVTQLSGRVERPVEDRTGLTGLYAFDLRWAAPVPASPLNDGAPSAAAPDDLPASIFTALQEQLGLKLEPTKAMAEFLVIDHVERPTPD